MPIIAQHEPTARAGMRGGRGLSAEAEDLAKVYPGGVTALDGISLAVDHGIAGFSARLVQMGICPYTGHMPIYLPNKRSRTEPQRDHGAHGRSGRLHRKHSLAPPAPAQASPRSLHRQADLTLKVSRPASLRQGERPPMGEGNVEASRHCGPPLVGFALRLEESKCQ